MGRVGWRLLRSGSESGAVLCIDFTLAKVRAQAGFGALAPHLPERYAVWATDEHAWPAAAGVPRAQLAEWVHHGGEVQLPVVAVFGFCASASLATALAGRLAAAGSPPPAVVLFDPVTVGAGTMVDQAADAMRRLGGGAVEGASGDDAPMPEDLGELATSLAARYARVATAVGAAKSIPSSIVDQLCRRVEANLRFLTLCAAAWSYDRAAAPDLLVLSRDHRVPAPLAGAPELRLAATQDELLAHPDAVRAAERGLAGVLADGRS